MGVLARRYTSWTYSPHDTILQYVPISWGSISMGGGVVWWGFSWENTGRDVLFGLDAGSYM